MTLMLGFPPLEMCGVKICVAPSSTLVLAGITVRAMSLVIVTAAVAFADESAWLMACTIKLAGAGNTCGAVKSPAVEIVPTAAFPPVIPFTFQLTDLLAVLLTVAVNCWVFPSSGLALCGATVTLIAGPPVIVTLAEALAVGSAWLVACTETLAGCGRICGAL
jgi:hypothetical protein